jgi:hypothetical protein
MCSPLFGSWTSRILFLWAYICSNSGTNISPNACSSHWRSILWTRALLPAWSQPISLDIGADNRKRKHCLLCLLKEPQQGAEFLDRKRHIWRGNLVDLLCTTYAPIVHIHRHSAYRIERFLPYKFIMRVACNCLPNGTNLV